MPDESPNKLALQLEHSSPGQSARVLQSKDRRERRDQDIAERLESPIPKGEVIPMRQPLDESEGDEIEVNDQEQRPQALTDRYPDRENGNYKPPIPPKSNSITKIAREMPQKQTGLTNNQRSPEKLVAGSSHQSSFAQKKA